MIVVTSATGKCAAVDPTLGRVHGRSTQTVRMLIEEELAK